MIRLIIKTYFDDILFALLKRYRYPGLNNKLIFFQFFYCFMLVIVLLGLC